MTAYTQTTPATVLFISSYPPRACGIATFSQDLLRAINNLFGASFTLRVCALEEAGSAHSYPPEVEYTLNALEPDDCIRLAERISARDDIGIVCIQHEFGLFGGAYGENLLYLLMNLNKPVVVTMHTVLPSPDPRRKSLVETIGELCNSIVVMTQHSALLLQQEYNVQDDKIAVIPHGLHNVMLSDREQPKTRLGLQGRSVLSTFGLLSSNKSIETALEALPRIAEQFPDVMYLVLGATHPGVLRHEGERYRTMLENKVQELGMQRHVQFVNRYLSLDDLLAYLCATDLYLFTSRDPHQAVSGTFSYAMSCACPIIATPIPHAKELLGDAGLIVDFEAPGQLADAAVTLLGDTTLRRYMACSAYERTRPLLWENAAVSHARLFNRMTSTPLCYTIPALSLDHLHRMTDANGVIQFSDLCIPEPESGYTLDDNARALAVTAVHYELTRDTADLPLLGTYLRFVECCRQADGRFLNIVDKHGDFSPENRTINLDDANGRTIAALGVLYSKESIPGSYRARAEQCLVGTFRHIPSIQSPRAIALAVRGLYYYNCVRRSPEVTAMIDALATRLVELYHAVAGEDWRWFENYLTYKNAVLPEALAIACRETGRTEYCDVALASMNFLLSRTLVNDRFRPVSNRGWMHRGEQPAEHGEQPIEAAATIQALEQFYYTFHDERYLRFIDTVFSWFLGNNHLGQVVYNSATGGCHDGIEHDRINSHQGAESTLSYLIAQLTVIGLKRSQSADVHDYALLPPASFPQHMVNRSA